MVSCTKENPADNTPSIEYQTIRFEAAAPSAEENDATKTTLVDGNLVHWSNGDQVKVGFFPTTNKQNTIVSCVGTFTATFENSINFYIVSENEQWFSETIFVFGQNR